MNVEYNIELSKYRLNKYKKQQAYSGLNVKKIYLTITEGPFSTTSFRKHDKLDPQFEASFLDIIKKLQFPETSRQITFVETKHLYLLNNVLHPTVCVTRK